MGAERELVRPDGALTESELYKHFGAMSPRSLSRLVDAQVLPDVSLSQLDWSMIHDPGI